MSDLHVIVAPQEDHRLGRQVVHDPRSRSFAFPAAALPELPTRRFRHRVYGPQPTPAQRLGCCTMVDQAVRANTVGNRVKGQVLDLAWAERWYEGATRLDPFPGAYPPDDTGSSGLAACKAAQEAGIVARYEWLFAGARQVLAALAGTDGRPGLPVGVGTWWLEGMFDPDPETLLVRPTGRRVGGHQWSVIGWEPRHRALVGQCWWGPGFGDHGRFLIGLDDLDALLADDGDAHVTYRRTS